jgi:hypothetical protein
VRRKAAITPVNCGTTADFVTTTARRILLERCDSKQPATAEAVMVFPVPVP